VVALLLLAAVAMAAAGGFVLLSSLPLLLKFLFIAILALLIFAALWGAMLLWVLRLENRAARDLRGAEDDQSTLDDEDDEPHRYGDSGW
jgi:hypothetical protein